MNKPHKHAAVIKACNNNYWKDLIQWENLQWFEGLDYRIKPETLKYRVALLCDSGLNEDEPYFYIVSVNTKEHHTRCEESIDFVRWITDWVEVKI